MAQAIRAILLARAIAATFVGRRANNDFKVGMEHLMRWELVAVVTDVEWIKRTMWFLKFLMRGEMKSFPTSEAAQARAWIVRAS